MQFFTTFAILRGKSVGTVKVEPVSSTNKTEPEDEKPDNPNVIVKQQPPADDYENDPEAGPSGLQTEGARINENKDLRMRQYRNDSSDDDSSDEREMASAIWRPQQSFRFSRNDDDSGDTRYSSHSWRFDHSTINEPVPIEVAPPPSNHTDEVIDLSENDSVQSSMQQMQKAPTNANRSLEVLTAPDLQLDWLSDSSSDTEIIQIRSRTPELINVEDVGFLKSNLNSSNASNDLPPIDLTVSDDEETTFLSDDNQDNANEVPTIDARIRRYSEILPARPLNCYRPLRSSNYHEDDRTERYVLIKNSFFYINCKMC